MSEGRHPHGGAFWILKVWAGAVVTVVLALSFVSVAFADSSRLDDSDLDVPAASLVKREAGKAEDGAKATNKPMGHVKKAKVAQSQEIEAPAKEDAMEILLPPKGGARALKHAFADWMKALKSGASEEAKAHEAKILQMRQTYAVEDLFLFSQVVLNEAADLIETDPSEAVSLARFASSLAPHRSAPQWMEFRAHLAQAKKTKNLSVSELWNDLVQAVKKSWNSPLEHGIRQLDWVVMIPMVLLCAIGLFFLICALRSARFLLHDFSHLTPAGIGNVCRFIFVVAITALLFELGHGVFLPIVFIGLLILPYLSIGERTVAVACALLLGTIPLVCTKVAEGNPFLSPEMQALYLVDMDGTGDAFINTQGERLLSGAERSYAISYTFGRKALRFGEYEDAKGFLKTASRLSQNKADPWVALGNIALSTGNMESAYENYTRARQHSSTSPEAAFDFSGYYMRRIALARINEGSEDSSPEQIARMKAQAKALFDEAVMLSPSLANVESDMRANLFLRTPFVGLNTLVDNPRQKPLAQKLCNRVNRVLFGTHSPEWALKAMLTVLALGLIYSVFRRLVPVSSPCFRCGAPTCGRCEALKCPSPGLCPDCFNAFGQKGRPDPMASARREVQIRNSRLRRKMAIMLSTVLIPGTGYLWRGKAILGFLSILCAIFPLAIIAFPGGVFPMAFDGMPDDAKRFPALVIFGLIWLTNVIITWRGLRRDLPTGTKKKKAAIASPLFSARSF